LQRADEAPNAQRRAEVLSMRWQDVDDLHLHDLRRPAASLMTGMGISRLTVKKILNHTERDVTPCTTATPAIRKSGRPLKPGGGGWRPSSAEKRSRRRWLRCPARGPGIGA
jgi:hypothetical protein